jgi:hypothetical protein
MLAPSVESVMKCSMAVALFSRIAVPRFSHTADSSLNPSLELRHKSHGLLCRDDATAN